jgi:hypothetical protein
MLLGAALCGVAVVIFDAVAGASVGWVAGVCTGIGLVIVWFAVPLHARRGPDD